MLVRVLHAAVVLYHVCSHGTARIKVESSSQQSFLKISGFYLCALIIRVHDKGHVNML